MTQRGKGGNITSALASKGLHPLTPYWGSTPGPHFFYVHLIILWDRHPCRLLYFTQRASCHWPIKTSSKSHCIALCYSRNWGHIDTNEKLWFAIQHVYVLVSKYSIFVQSRGNNEQWTKATGQYTETHHSQGTEWHHSTRLRSTTTTTTTTWETNEAHNYDRQTLQQVS